MSFDTTIHCLLRFVLNGEQQSPYQTYTVESNTAAQRYSGSSDNTGWDTIYDASQVSVPPIGNADTGDAPFVFWFSVTGGSDAILKITDDQGDVGYVTVRNGHCILLTSDIFGSTTTAVIEQIDVQSSSATDTNYEYLIQHD